MRRIVSLLFLSIFSLPLFATHGAHIEFHYYWKQDSTYVINAVFFESCFKNGNPNPPSSLSLMVRSSSRNYNGTTYLTIDSASTFLDSMTGIFECGNPDSICRRVYTYSGEWTSPGRANDWLFSYQLCCRLGSGGADALENLEPSTFYTEFSINNLDFPDQVGMNISPVWHNPLPQIPGHLNDTNIVKPLHVLCQNKLYNLNHEANEYQGDSLVYSFYHPQANGGDTASYKLGYNTGNPLPTGNPGISLDQTNGMISFRTGQPKDIGYFVIALRLDEYRNNKLLGFIKKEITIHITDSVSTGIKKQNAQKINVYPNPSDNGIFVLDGLNHDAVISVYSMLGEEIVVEKPVDGILDLSSESNGLYFLKVQDKGVVRTYRLVVR